MARKIALIQGHPDSHGGHFCHALADAYAAGAERAGHQVRRIDIAALDFPLLRSQADFEQGAPVADITTVQEAIQWAEHLVIVYPLWLGTMPALMKGFLEQVFRPGFAFSYESAGWPKKMLSGRSARVIITMGMPAVIYRWVFLAHSLRSLERNILRFTGIRPVRDTVIGMVEALKPEKRQAWLKRMGALGERAR
ncbi:MAG: NAD(P)H-dependent oxidoreductase [Bauldia litoralis]